MAVKHKVTSTILRRERYEDLPERYLADKKSGKWPLFEDGQEFMVENEDFFRMLYGTCCSETWDCISRYMYSALQGDQ
jgi:uncharacterized repeat protein (TIGR04076 family)